MDRNIVELFHDAVNKYPDHIIYRYRDKGKIFLSITYSDFYKKVEEFASGLIDLKLDQKRMALVSDNCIEWMICVIANMGLGGIDVPRGLNSPPDELEYILSHADVDFICLQNKEAEDRINQINFDKKKIRIIFNAENIELTDNSLSFEKVCSIGRNLLDRKADIFIKRFKKLKPDDIASIIYTSGTTGSPKGVMLSHKNLTYSPTQVPCYVTAYDTDRWLSILPVWHVGERFFEFMAVIHGVTVILSSPFSMRDDMLKEKPHLIPGVPLVWKKTMDAIIKGMDESGKGGVFRFFYDKSLRYKKALGILNGLDLRYKKITFIEKIFAFFKLPVNGLFHLIAKKIIYKKIAARTGGSVRMITSGGGRLQNEADDFFDIIGFNVIDGYGSTETAVIVTIRADRHVKYTIGKITAGTQYKIIDSETSKVCNAGEPGVLFVKGDQVFKGYYKNEKAYKEVFDSDGFYNTGDIVRETITGDLVFVGRSKDTIVLLNGENVEPEPIEEALENIKYIKHAVITGQDKEELSALIVPDIDMLSSHPEFQELRKNIKLLKEPELTRFYRDEIKRVINIEKGFKVHELVKNVILITEEFVQGKELTNTMKKKRNYIYDKYRELIENI